MKILIFFFVLLLSFNFAAAQDEQMLNPAKRTIAQENKKPKKKKKATLTSMSVGVFAGPSFSYGAVDEPQEGSTHNAFSILTTVEMRLTPILYLEGGMQYAQRGVQKQLGPIIQADVKLDYLEFPLWLMVKANIFGPRTRLFFSAGPALGFAFNRSAEVWGTFDVGLSDRFESYDFSVSVGAGIEQRLLKTLKLVGQVRYLYGLMDIDKEESTYYTRGIVILLGARFPF